MKTIQIDGIEYELTPITTEETIEVTYSDWRLPTIDELKTLVNYNRHNPACDLEDTISGRCWSCSTFIDSTFLVWGVSFAYGSVSSYDKSNNSYVRCVRDGENGLEWSASSGETMDWDEAKEYAKNLEASVYYKKE